MLMNEVLCKQSKETRCYIMAALLYFDGYKGDDEMSEIDSIMRLDVLGLTKEEIGRFPMPKKLDQIVAHIKTISDSEVRHWVIRNTYVPVLQGKRRDALRDFNLFCEALKWDAKEIKEDMQLTEELINY